MRLQILAGSAFTAILAQSLQAQYAPPPPTRPFPGFINEWLRKDDPYMAAWDIGGSVRMRYEIKENGGATGAGSAGDFRANGVDNDNSYLMSRIRARLGYTGKWFNVLVEGRSSSTTGDDRAPGAGPESDGIVDLHQAYLTLGNHKEFPVSVKIGRQELSYGDERIIGAFAWNNVGRVFDLAKVRWQNPWFAADFFSGRVVIPDDNNFNVPNDYDYFSGIYASTKKIPKHLTEFYLLSRNTSGGAATANGAGTRTPAPYNPSPRDIYTIGMRLKSATNELGNWDYTAEIMGQFGHFNDGRLPVGSRSLEQRAYAIAVNAGYTFKDTFGSPRLAFEYAEGSGDDNPNDGIHGTFENLFPTNHKFYGYMDFFSLENIRDLRGIFQIRPMSRLSLALEGHAFLLANDRDNLYNVGGAPRGGLGNPGGGAGTGYGINTGYSKYVGTEIDLIGGFAVNHFTQLEAGYGHFIRGDYVKSTFSNAAFGSKDADYIYTQLTLNW